MNYILRKPFKSSFEHDLKYLLKLDRALLEAHERTVSGEKKIRLLRQCTIPKFIQDWQIIFVCRVDDPGSLQLPLIFSSYKYLSFPYHLCYPFKQNYLPTITVYFYLPVLPSNFLALLSSWLTENFRWIFQCLSMCLFFSIFYIKKIHVSQVHRPRVGEPSMRHHSKVHDNQSRDWPTSCEWNRKTFRIPRWLRWHDVANHRGRELENTGVIQTGVDHVSIAWRTLLGDRKVQAPHHH